MKKWIGLVCIIIQGLQYQVLADTPPSRWVFSQVYNGAGTQAIGNVSDSLKVNVTNTVPVSGTFWQATQPVSGTFWQSTQPVSLTSLPAFASTPTFNLGTLNGAATNATLVTINSTLGSPFQAGGSIGNTAFGISGTLPAFASTPTFNLGTLNGAATATNQTTLDTDLLSFKSANHTDLGTIDTDVLAFKSANHTDLGTLNTSVGTVNTSVGTLDTDFNTKTGSLTETAPSTDTASSGLNGRLQRIAQRLTTTDTDLNSFASANHTDIIGTQPRNLSQVGGNSVNTGTGAASTGTQRVAVANDSKIQLWDGTNTAAVKAGSTAPSASDTAQVVTISPNGNQVQGNVAHASADSGNPVKIGGVYRASTQTLSDGQRSDAEMNVHGSFWTDAATTDISGTFTTTGTTAAIDASGYASIAFTATVSASSGTTPTLDLQLQESDDGVNDWNEEYDADRFTGTGSYKSIRQSIHARYYRYRYVIGGTTPSFTFTVKTTLKNASAPIIHTYNRFNDLVMTTANNFSSTADLEGCSFWTAVLTRGAGGAGVTIVNQVSNDGLTWFNSTSTNSSASTSYLISNIAGSSTKYSRFTNTSNQAAATTLDIKWYCKE